MAGASEIAPPSSAVINGIRINWAKEHYEGFWCKAERGDWEPQTYREIDLHVTPDTIFIDFGANIGAITLYAAKKAARVICFEPDPRSRANLLANIQVNPDIAGKITVVAKAAHSSGQPIRFGSQACGGDSMSSTILPDLKTVWTVETMTAHEINSMLPTEAIPIFVKMDIEGGEYDLIPAARALWNRPNLTLLLQTHQNVLERFVSRNRIRSMTGTMFAALRDYKIRQVGAEAATKHIGLSLLHRLGLAAPLTGHDWLFTRQAAKQDPVLTSCLPR
jgi:FkbM family methyltransferase